MGANYSKEKELNEDLERIRKERIAEAKHIGIVKAAQEGWVADVQLVLQHAPERVNEQNRLLLLLTYSHAADCGCGAVWEHRSALRCIEELSRSCQGPGGSKRQYGHQEQGESCLQLAWC